MVEPVVAVVDPNLCKWCDECTRACPFDAIFKNEQGVAHVNDTVCKGCGMCLPVCPTNAIQLKTFTDNEIESMIDVLANEL